MSQYDPDPTVDTAPRWARNEGMDLEVRFPGGNLDTVVHLTVDQADALQAAIVQWMRENGHA